MGMNKEHDGRGKPFAKRERLLRLLIAAGGEVFCALLLAFLCLLFVNTARAEDIEETVPYRTSGIDGAPQDAEMNVVYSDTFFSESSYKMNMDIGRLALRLAFFGFGSGENSDATDLLRLFDVLGIRYEEGDGGTVHFVTPGADTIGFAYGVRELSADEILVVAVVRGGNYQTEWAGNFTLGTTADHEGFKTCADLVTEELSEYLRSLSGRKVSLLLTGYSRGAAVSNLAAADLDRLASEGKLGAVAPENLYAYCFACPLTTTREDTSGELFANIFSFVHPADPVPKVAPGKWGYRRYGTTVILPTAVNDDAYYKTFSKEFCEAYWKFTKSDAIPPEGGSALTQDRDMTVLAERLISRTVYAKTVQGAIRSAFLGDSSETSNNPMASMITSFLGGLAGAAGGETGGGIPGGAMVAHAPELYLAALETLGDGSRLTTVRRQYGYLTYDGEVTVSVMDSAGNVFTPKVDDMLAGREGARMVMQYGSGGEVSLLYSPEERYAVAFSAEADKELSLSCGVIDSTIATDIRRSEFNKVKLASGESLVLVTGPEGTALYRVSAGALPGVFMSAQSGGRPDASVATPVKADKQFGESEDTPVTPTPELSAEPSQEATPTPAGGTEATVSPMPTLTPIPTPSPAVSDAGDERAPKPLWKMLAIASGIILLLSTVCFIRRKKGDQK